MTDVKIKAIVITTPPFDAHYGFALKTFPVQCFQYTVYMVSVALGPQSLQQDIE